MEESPGGEGRHGEEARGKAAKRGGEGSLDNWCGEHMVALNFMEGKPSRFLPFRNLTFYSVSTVSSPPLAMPSRRPASRPARLSLATAVQRSRLPGELLELASHRRPSPQEALPLLSRIVQLTPRGSSARALDEAQAVREDPRLHALLARTVGSGDLAAPSLCALLWALAVLRRPLRRGEGGEGVMCELGRVLGSEAEGLDVHSAAQAAWAWSSLARDLREQQAEGGVMGDGLFDSSPPTPLRMRASTLPFAVHLGVCASELGDPADSLQTLLRESRPERGTIRSGSQVSLDAKTVRFSVAPLL